MQLWLCRESKPPFRLIGLSAEWDEAGQRMRQLLEHTRSDTGAAQKIVHILIAFCSVVQLSATVDDGGRLVWRLQQQPWVCPPMCLLSTAQPYLAEGLARVLPFDLLDPSQYPLWTSGTDLLLVVLGFDAASANLAHYYKVCCTLEENDACAGVIVHGERCGTHALHPIKTRPLITAKISWGSL